MNETTLLQAAQSEGLVPAGAQAVVQDREASWIVTSVSLIGAQFAMWPFLLALAIFGENLFLEPPGSLIMSALLLCVAVMGLRKTKGHFVEHLCFTALMVGLGLLAFSLLNLQGFEFRNLNGVFFIVAAVAIGVALVIRVAWVQQLLGFIAASLLMLLYFGPADNYYFLRWLFPSTSTATLLALLWCGWCVLEPRASAQQPVISRKVAALADGLALALLFFALFTSGSVLTGQGLFDGANRTGSADMETAGIAPLFYFSQQVLLQFLLVLGSGVFLVMRWQLLQPAKRRELALLCAVYAGLMLFSFFTHDGGVVVLVGTAALATGRKRLLILALLILLAQLSGFYYALGWTLVKKASVLVAAGAVLAVFLALLHRHYREPSVAATTAHANRRSRWAAGLIAACAVLSLGAINYDVAKKEQVINDGQKIFVRIAPRDPRSLMQGDYMALNFDFPREIRSALEDPNQAGRVTQDPNRTLVVAKIDGRGVASVLRLAGLNEALAAGEVLLPLKRINDNWVVVTDAFFFTESKGAALRGARFGEFRVLPGGRALLVGLVDENLQPMKLDQKDPVEETEAVEAPEMGDADAAVVAPDAAASSEAIEEPGPRAIRTPAK